MMEMSVIGPKDILLSITNLIEGLISRSVSIVHTGHSHLRWVAIFGPSKLHRRHLIT